MRHFTRPMSLFFIGFALGVSLLLPISLAGYAATEVVAEVLGSPPGPPLGSQPVDAPLARL